jgi:hypothetical protein
MKNSKSKGWYQRRRVLHAIVSLFGVASVALAACTTILGDDYTEGLFEDQPNGMAGAAGTPSVGEIVCMPGDRHCEGPVLQQCNPPQTGWINEQICV